MSRMVFDRMSCGAGVLAAILLLMMGHAFASVGSVNVVIDGDSIAVGQGAAPDQTPAAQLQRMLGPGAVVRSVAASGRPVKECDRLYDTLVAPLYDPQAGRNVIAFHSGDNDIARHESAQEAYGYFTDYVAKAHRQGWAVIMTTELFRPDFSPENEAELEKYDDLVRANAAKADIVIDTARFPIMADHLNRAIFQQDRLHYSAEGYRILALSIMAAIAELPSLPTQLVLHRSGDRLEGQLTDTDGHPVAGAPVAIMAELAGTPDAPAAHTITGQVPSNATSALFALRINTECTCSGPADVAIGVMSYRDDRTARTVSRSFLSPAGQNVAGRSVDFQARPGQPIGQNTPNFPVTAGDPFTLKVPIAGDPTSAGSGYVALIWVDPAGKEIPRLRIPLAPPEVAVANVTTDAQGRFSVLPNPGASRTSTRFRGIFAGDPQHLTVSAALL